KPDIPDMSSQIERWSAQDTGSNVKGSDSPTVVESTERIESFRQVKMLSNINEVAEIVERIKRDETKSMQDMIGDVPAPDQQDHAVVVAFNDTRSAFEISGKMSDLGLKHSFSVVAIGNNDPADMEGMRCSKYIMLKGTSVKGFSDYLVRYIREKQPK
ncbi:electron transfer flavoprotein, alpha and beta subunits related protein, partial [mine drainage metagenome]